MYILDENLSHNKYISKLSKGIFFATNSKSLGGNSLLGSYLSKFNNW